MTESSPRDTPTDAPEQEKPATLKGSAFAFAHKGKSVTRGHEFIAEARSPSMARRIAQALNVYEPGPDGR